MKRGVLFLLVLLLGFTGLAVGADPAGYGHVMPSPYYNGTSVATFSVPSWAYTWRVGVVDAGNTATSCTNSTFSVAVKETPGGAWLTQSASGNEGLLVNGTSPVIAIRVTPGTVGSDGFDGNQTYVVHWWGWFLK